MTMNAAEKYAALKLLEAGLKEALTAAGQVVGSLKGLAGYVLPGQTALITLKHTSRHTFSALRAYLNDDHHASQIPLRPLASRAPVLATADAVSPD